MFSILFQIFAFILPFVFYPKSSELFEFNKLVVVYGFAIILAFLWSVRSIVDRKITFNKTSLWIPVMGFLLSLLLASLHSIDLHTSIFGYYSRFHGGLLSYFAYSILFFAYATWLGKRESIAILKIMLLSAAIISVYGIFEHFGKSFSCLAIRGEFNTSCWVQDVRHRVFATFGQPNWLAAWVVSLIPITWSFSLISKLKESHKNYRYYLAGYSLMYLTLLYTGSRSGFIGFLVSFVVFWGFILAQMKFGFGKIKPVLLHITVLTFILAGLAGTPWSPPLYERLQQPDSTESGQQLGENQIETGGTESGEIRQIVWKGAIELWKHNPILGTGVETFAYSYYWYRPMEHNYVSEWNFIYNKAHNEYLNFAATTGSVGLISYVSLIVCSVLLIIKQIKSFKKGKNSESFISVGLVSGYISILVTNFFGFSVVMVIVVMFVFPAIAISFSKERESKFVVKDVWVTGKIWLVIALCVFIFAGYKLISYWHADYLYAQGRSHSRNNNLYYAEDALKKAVAISPSEPVYYDELSDVLAQKALSEYSNGNEERAMMLATQSADTSDIAVALSPKNVKIVKSRVNILSNLGQIDPQYFSLSILTLKELSALAPTDPSVPYLMAVSYARIGDTETSIKLAEQAVSMKPNYKNARVFLAYIYKQVDRNEEAKEQLYYVIEHISPDDENILGEIKILEDEESEAN